MPQSLDSITSCWQEDGSVVTWGDPGAGGVPEAQQEFAHRMTQTVEICSFCRMMSAGQMSSTRTSCIILLWAMCLLICQSTRYVEVYSVGPRDIARFECNE